MTDQELLKKIGDIALWQRIYALTVVILVSIVVALWFEVRAATIRVRWIERKMDQGKMFVVDDETFKEWQDDAK